MTGGYDFVKLICLIITIKQGKCVLHIIATCTACNSVLVINRLSANVEQSDKLTN